MLENERGGDEEQDPGELESQPTFLRTDALQPQRHLASATKPSPDEDVQRSYHDDRNDRNETAVDRVHDEIGKRVILTTAADLDNDSHSDSCC